MDLGHVLCLLPAVVFFCGCDGLVRAKHEARTNFTKALQFVSAGAPVRLPAPDGAVEYSELKVADSVLRLPRSRSEPEFEGDQRAWLTYGPFRVTIYVALKDDSGLAALPEPGTWGASEFDRYRAIYSLGEKDLDAAKSAKELSHVVSGLAIKGILLTDGSEKRLVEFRSPTLKGFILGSADAGSRAVVFECFANDQPHARKMTVAFSRLDPTVRDSEIEQFVAAIEITDGTETNKRGD